MTSTNYDDYQKKTTGGRNGYGAKLTKIFLHWICYWNRLWKEVEELEEVAKSRWWKIFYRGQILSEVKISRELIERRDIGSLASLNWKMLMMLEGEIQKNAPWFLLKEIQPRPLLWVLLFNEIILFFARLSIEDMRYLVDVWNFCGGSKLLWCLSLKR